MRTSRIWIALCLMALVMGGVARGADEATRPAGVLVAGEVVKGQTWTGEQMKADFAKEVKTIQYEVKGEKRASLGVPLAALVNAAEVKVDAKVKNQALRFVVVVEGKDGYMASFSWAELQADVGNREVWVILDVDGKGLSERDGPASLVVPGDGKPGRWVHGIKAVTVRDAGSVGGGR